MRKSFYLAVGVTSIAAAAMAGASTPAFAATAAGTHATAITLVHDTTPTPAAPGQQFSLNPTKSTPAGCTAAADSPACDTRQSSTTQAGINQWDFGGAQLGSGAANLISGTFTAVPSFVVDLAKQILGLPGDLIGGIVHAFVP